jgi:hypothetical protein
MTADATTVTTRIVLWPSRDPDFRATVLEDPLADATDDEARFFAEQYADVPLLELWRRLRRAEWDAAYYEQEHRAAVEREKRLPPRYLIEEMDARHKRIRGLLAAPGRISRADLEAALREPVTATPTGVAR